MAGAIKATARVLKRVEALVCICASAPVTKLLWKVQTLVLVDAMNSRYPNSEDRLELQKNGQSAQEHFYEQVRSQLPIGCMRACHCYLPCLLMKRECSWKYFLYASGDHQG